MFYRNGERLLGQDLWEEYRRQRNMLIVACRAALCHIEAGHTYEASEELTAAIAEATKEKGQ